MVGRKWDGDRLIENPNPKWAITESTRDMLRTTINKAIDDGWSPQKLSDAIRGDDAAWQRRADMISRTELQAAHQNGNIIGWKDSGVVKGKQSLCVEDTTCPICITNAGEGAIPLDAAFPSGAFAPPYHPNCLCTLLPVLEEDMP